MQLFFQLGWYFLREWRRYFAAIVLLIIVAILQLIPPYIVGVVVDGVTKQHVHSNQILGWISLMVLIALAIYVLRYFWRLMLFGTSYHLAVELREKLYQQLSRQHPAFYSRYRTGDLMAHATNDVDKVVEASGAGVLMLVDSTVLSGAVLVVMSTQISWQLTLLALLPMPFMAMVIKRLSRQLHQQFRIAQESFSRLNNRSQESLTSIRMIKAFGLEYRQAAQFAEEAEQAAIQNMQVARIDARFDPTIYSAVGLAYLLSIAGGSWMVVHNSLSLGQLTSFTIYLGIMIWPMLALALMFNVLGRGSAAYSRLCQILDEPPVVADGTQPVPEGAGVLQVRIDNFSYPPADTDSAQTAAMQPANNQAYNNRYNTLYAHKQSAHQQSILQNVAFTLAPGQILGLCGPTGAGKTTLLALIQRHYDVNQGEIRFHDVPLPCLQLNNWRQRLAVVNQTPFLFSDNVANNIALGNPVASQQEIEQAARLACVHEDILRLPQGYDTEVGERGVMLSGGQKQRISIARALLLQSEILILDDALSAVDGRTEHQILQNLRQWATGRTLIISAHRLSALIHASEILVLQQGHIVQRGNHAQLSQQTGWYRDMYHYQQLEAALDNDSPLVDTTSINPAAINSTAIIKDTSVLNNTEPHHASNA